MIAVEMLNWKGKTLRASSRDKATSSYRMRKAGEMVFPNRKNKTGFWKQIPKKLNIFKGKKKGYLHKGNKPNFKYKCYKYNRLENHDLIISLLEFTETRTR